MHQELTKLMCVIEDLRDKLSKLLEEKGTIDPEVIIASEMLDCLINEYYKLLKNKNRE
jgi:stage 0 sporulation regulatory protein